MKQEEAAKGRVEQEKSSLKQEISELQKKLQQSELVCHTSLLYLFEGDSWERTRDIDRLL